MSFKNPKTIVEEGDTVILYFSVDQIFKIEVTAQRKSKDGTKIVENTFQTRFGAIKPFDLIGKKYGSKIKLTRGWGYILQPTTDLWTKTLPHRTQIIYGPDISLILFLLELKPGSVVLEAGTGSGSLSHAIVNTVKPTGKLFTFDYHQERVNVAQEEFNQHGINKWIQTKCCDVYTEGFMGITERIANAIFLDLPKPWLVLPFTTSILNNKGGRICCFSPCIEQVQKTTEVLLKLDFNDINTMEVIQTTFNVYHRTYSDLNLNIYKSEKPKDIKTEENLEDVSEKKFTESDKSLQLLIHSPMPETQTGHSGYLTFATYYPELRRDSSSLNLNNESNNLKSTE